VRVIVSARIMPEGTDWAAAVMLRDTARAALLAHLGEPDLAQETPRV
jgi:hypothetical protein